MINYLLIALLFAISLILVRDCIINLKAERYRKKNIRRLRTNEDFFKSIISKINLIRTKEDFLSKQGYPFKLNIYSYFLIKFFLAITFFTAGIINYNSIIVASIFSATGFYIIDVLIISNKKTRDSEICIDLMHITSSICLQLSAGVSLKNSLKKQYENCKNCDMRKSFLEFATKYELSELNIMESTKMLTNRFDILEMNMFCKALETYNETTRIEEVLDNLTQMLKKKNIERIKKNTLTKILYITFGVVIALGNIIMIIFYPLFINIGQGFNSIFK